MASDDGSTTTGRTRSKAGCLTCRQRRKKCDETHSSEHGGACQRCTQGAWKCEWPPPAGAAPVKVFERGARVRAKQERAAVLQAERAQSCAPVASSSSASSAFASPDAPPPSYAPVASTSILHPTAAFNPPHVAPASLSSHLTYQFPPHPSPSPAVPPGFLSQHLAVSPFIPPAMSMTGTGVPSFAQPHGAFVGVPPAGGLDDFFQSVDLTLAAAPARASAVEAGAAKAGSDAAGAEEGDELPDPAYDVLFQSYIFAMSPPLQEMIMAGIRETIQSSAACRHAALATSTLCRLWFLLEARKDCATPLSPGTTEEEEQRLRAKSDEYYQRAMDYLGQQSIALMPKFMALGDLWMHQFMMVGAEAASFLTLLGEIFAQELGPRPVFQHSQIQSAEQAIIAFYAWEDCVRCVTAPRRRPFFTFADLPGEPLSASSPALLRDSVKDVPTDMPMLGYKPLGHLLCIAAIANLSVDMDALPDEVVQAKAGAIERALRGWRPLPPINDIDSAMYVEQVATCEMWRHAIIIYLYQAVHRHGPLSDVLASAVQQILRIGTPFLQSYEPGRATDLVNAFSPAASPASTGSGSGAGGEGAAAAMGLFAPMCRAVPFFLAGTCALAPVERRICLAGLRACGPDKGFVDDVRALERIWERQRRDGWPRDWREVLEEEKLHVVFM
ncbi:hypothetical protein JCM10449v2_002823 [Rhodotorula kratochvilovae]